MHLSTCERPMQIMDVHKIRRANLRRLIEQWGGPTTLAKRLGHASGSYLAQLAGPNPSREVNEKVARSIEQALDLPANWLDQQHNGNGSNSASRKRDVDVTMVSRVIELASAALGKHQVAASTLAELVALVYEHAQGHGAIDERYLQRLVNLIKAR